MYGYAGKLLFVDLTKGTITEEELTQEMAEMYLGGYGFGAKIMLDRMPKHADPLGPDNILGFIPGALNLSGAAISGRYTVVHKSPVTNGFNDANSGGFLGNEIKKAGYDGIFVSGVSSKPVYLWVSDGKAEIRDASHLWGLDAKEIQKALQNETGEPKLRAAAIGPAGENLSLFAAIINDGHRAAARGGTGTVMGSKKLKAVAVYGTGKIELADRAKISELNKIIGGLIKEPPHGFIPIFRSFGTSALTAGSALSGDSPVKNWSGVGIVDFGEENAKKVAIETYDDKYKTKKYACANCLLGCGAEYRVNDGQWPIGETERPEYETMSAFGTNCLNADIEAIFKCNEICNRSGIDTITAGSTVAWVMECFDNGVLTKEELDGIEPTWGNATAMVALTEKIARNEGCGKKLALGQQGAADAFGKGHEYLTVCSGIEPAMHDGRFAQGYARMYQFDPTPGRHVKGGNIATAVDDPESVDPDFTKVMPANQMTNIAKVSNMEVVNSVGICMFSDMIYPPNWINEALTAAIGGEFTPERSYYTGLRLFMQRHAFNIREGILRKDFSISPRLLGNPPLKEGPNANVVIPNDHYGDVFFEQLGCDVETGIPTKEILEKIGGLEHVIEILYGA